MNNYPICKSCGKEMTEYDGCSWYACPECGQAVRDNGNGSWTWRDEIFKQGTKHWDHAKIIDNLLRWNRVGDTQKSEARNGRNSEAIRRGI